MQCERSLRALAHLAFDFPMHLASIVFNTHLVMADIGKHQRKSALTQMLGVQGLLCILQCVNAHVTQSMKQTDTLYLRCFTMDVLVTGNNER